MLKGMKAKQQLAAFVALAVGGAFAGAPVAYAAATSVDTNDARMAPATGTSTSTAYQGISGSDSKLLNSVTDNTLTIGTAGATYLPFVTGDVSAGGTTSTTSAVTGNTLIINNINLTGNAYGGIGANQVYTSGTAQTNPNTLTMTGGTVTGSLIGARSIAGGASSGEVTLTGGTVGAGTNAFAIAGGMGHTDAINNKVTLTGGTVTGAVYGGYAENSGAKTTGNTVTLGDASGNYSNGTLSGASIYGGNDSDYTNNRLVVQAKGITADAAQNFATYEFHLNTGIAADNTMLTLTNGSNALGRTVNIGDIKVDATGWSGAARTAYYGDVGTVTLMADGSTTNNASNLSIAGTSRTGWDGDYEYQITVNPQTSGLTTRNYVRAALHRYMNANATYNSAATTSNTIYGGYSIWENKVVQDNNLTITNAAGTMTAYGGYTSTGADAVRNKLTMTGGMAANLYGAYATGTGKVEDNHVSVSRASGNTAATAVTGEIIGAHSAGTGVVQKNTVTVDNATVGGSVTGASGTTTVSENSVTIQGDAVTNTVHSVVGGNVLGAYIVGDNTVQRTAEKNSVTITEGDVQGIVYGVFGELFGAGSSSTTTVTPTVQNNTVTISGGAVKDVHGVHMAGQGGNTGIGTATNNTVTVSDTAKVGGTLYGATANGDARLDANKVVIKGGTLSGDVYGASGDGKGAVTGSIVTISEGKIADNVIGGRNTDTAVDAGAVTGSKITVTGGEIRGHIYGGVTHADLPSSSSTTATASGGNTVTITGGTIGGNRPDGTVRGNIYGGYAYGTNKTVETGNTVNLGADDGTYTADLTKATIYGGASSATGNTLNVKANKPVEVRGVHNFENYKFWITKDTQVGDTMLKLTDHNGFDNLYSGTRRVNFSNVDVDLTNMSAKQIAGEITLIDGSHANALEFDNYNPRGTSAPTASNGDYEYALRTDTDTYQGQKVLMEYNRYQNGVMAYDATSTSTDWFAGLSRGGHTTENNHLTINAPLSRSITAYGAKTMGASGGSGGTKGNILDIQSTGTNDAYEVTRAYGGYIDRSTNADTVANNVLRMAGGRAGTLYGGYSAGTGSVTKNTVQVTDGTVTGDIYAGYAATAGNATSNTLILGKDDGTYSATIAGEIYGSNAATGTGNTLVVQAGNVSVQKVHNFDTFNFILHNNSLMDGTMLKIEQTGGLGGTVNFGNIKADVSKFAIDKSWMGSRSVKLIESTGAMNFSNYAATPVPLSNPNDPYEALIQTNTKIGQGANVLLTFNRLYSGHQLYGATNATLTAEEVFRQSADADQELYTGISELGNDVHDNTLRITGLGANGLSHFAAAGYTTGAAGDLTNNALTLSSANALTIRNVYGGYAANTASAAKVTGNSVTLTHGALSADNVYGGYTAGSDKAESNKVLVTGGSVSLTPVVSSAISGAIYGGASVSGDAEKNEIDLHAVSVTGDVVGGQGTDAKDNTVTLRGTQISGTVYGGRLADGRTSAVVGNGNTLNIYDMGTKVGYFEPVEKLNFYLSEKADPTRSMLTTTQAKNKDLRGTTITVELSGDHTPIHNGDVVKLVTLPNGNNLDIDSAYANQTYKTTQGVTLNYDYGLETRNTASNSTVNRNELIARIKGVTVNDQSKSLVETQSAAIAFLTSGSDLLTDVGIPAAETAATQIADIVDAPLASGEKKSGATAAPLSNLGSYQLFAAQSFGNMRLKTGSYVDTKGWNLNVGFARRNEMLSSSLTFGPFIEYGRGSYDSYLDDGTHGDGKTSYIGFGVMAKSVSDSGTYFEGSLRVGRAKNDYSGTVGTRATSYDGSSTYFAGHLGIGHKTEFDSGNKFETYAKYFYAHQAGTSAKLSSGETYDFGASSSSRIRFGTRYTMKNDMDGEFYAGLAWEYEFDGKGTASYQGFDLPSTSLKGGTTLFELGYRFAPVDSTVSYGLNLTGFKGKRKGFTGGFNIAWAF